MEEEEAQVSADAGAVLPLLVAHPNEHLQEVQEVLVVLHQRLVGILAELVLVYSLEEPD